jgi:hypothetical protein
MPARRRSPHDQVLSDLETFLDGVIRRGGDGNVSVAKPLPRRDRRDLAARLPPGTAATFCEISAHIVVRWRLDEAAQARLPRALVECYAADVDLHTGCFTPVDATWTTYADPHWTDRAVFAPDGSGNYFGIDPAGKGAGRVRYLSHDLDDDTHGMLLGRDLGDLLLRWARLGCVGPGGETLRPFVPKRGQALDPRGAAAKRFRKLIVGARPRTRGASAKPAKDAALAARIDAVVAAPRAAFDELAARMHDAGTQEWSAFRPYAVELIGSWYGRAPSADLQALIRNTPGNQVGWFEPATNPGTTTPFVNAFVQVISDASLLRGVLTDSWPIGRAEPFETFLVGVSPTANEVTVARPLGGYHSFARSLPVFAQLLAIDRALQDVFWDAWQPDDVPARALRRALARLSSQIAPRSPTADATDGPDAALYRILTKFSPAASDGFVSRAARLGARAASLCALFENDAALAQSFSRGEKAPPAKLDDLDGADALFWLWTASLTAPREVVRSLATSAARHPALLVRDAAQVLETLRPGEDPANPANFLHLARSFAADGVAPALDAAGASPSPDALLAPAADDTGEIRSQKKALSTGHVPDVEVAWADLAYEYRSRKRWPRLLAVSRAMIDARVALETAWTEYAYALAGLARHPEVLRAVDRALLFCRLDRDELFFLKARALAELGRLDAAAEHLFWITPTRRLGYAAKHPALRRHWKKVLST